MSDAGFVPFKSVELLRLRRVDDLGLKELIAHLQSVEDSDAYFIIEDDEDYDGYMETSLVVYVDVPMTPEEIEYENTKEQRELEGQIQMLQRRLYELKQERESGIGN